MQKRYIIHGESFSFRKTQSGWEFYHCGTGVFVLARPLKREAIEDGRTLISGKSKKEVIQAVKSTENKIRKNRFWCKPKVQSLFRKLFSAELDNFRCIVSRMMGTYSLDAIAFDKFLQPPDGVSTYEFIKIKAGPLGVKLVKKLI